MQPLVKKIKERVNIVDIIGSFIKLDRNGINHKACCPFHHEKTPSFFVSEQRQTFNCFGCGLKGDVVEFVKMYEHLDFKEALRYVFDKTGLPESDWQQNQERSREDMRADQERKDAQDVFEKVIQEYHEYILHKNNENVLLYLTNRGLKMETINLWKIGYSPNMWNFIENKITSPLLEKVGIVKAKDGKRYDFFRDRIIFPIFDIQGHAIAISARIVDQGEPKYLNSPDTILFNKSETLYGLDKAKDGIRKFKYAILVEGQMDLLLCHQEGFNNAVATSGTALTDKHLQMLRRYTNNLMLLYDADKAGLNATVKAWTLALKYGFEVKTVVMPAGEDPASLLLKDKKKFMQIIKNGTHVIDFVISQSDNKSRISTKASLEKIIPLIASLESSVDKEFFSKKTAEFFELSPENINAELQKYSQNEYTYLDRVDRSIDKNENYDKTKYAVIDKALAEFKSLVYIYNQQLNTLVNSSESLSSGSDTTQNIDSYIHEYKNSDLFKLQQEYIPDLNSVFDTILEVDEDIIFNLENIYTQKKVGLDFYKQEVDISHKNFLQKIHNLIYQEIQNKLKKAEIIKDTNLIHKYTQDINILWQNLKK
ncbi:DNA primase [Candidatus Parcubacteria bacterium]|nr:DNA primase [Candidatus Parcubacteria bacterium]